MMKPMLANGNRCTLQLLCDIVAALREKENDENAKKDAAKEVGQKADGVVTKILQEALQTVRKRERTEDDSAEEEGELVCARLCLTLLTAQVAYWSGSGPDTDDVLTGNGKKDKKAPNKRMATVITRMADSLDKPDMAAMQMAEAMTKASADRVAEAIQRRTADGQQRDATSRMAEARLQLDRELADRRLVHEAEQAAAARQHELALAKQRADTDAARAQVEQARIDAASKKDADVMAMMLVLLNRVMPPAAAPAPGNLKWWQTNPHLQGTLIFKGWQTNPHLQDLYGAFSGSFSFYWFCGFSSALPYIVKELSLSVSFVELVCFIP
jgi:hypothetical protein